MERGGFHGYRKLPNTSSGLKLSDISARLSEINRSDNNNNQTSAVAVAAAATSAVAGDDNECTVREQDRFMPIANVIRIMRKILPPHAKISDDAKETIQECVSEFISFITGEANERCQREQRKTITAEDVLWAMSKLGFDDYIEPLTIYLHRYREMEGDRGTMRGEPLLKRTTTTTVEYAAGSLGVAAFAPAFHIGHHHHHGFFGYIKEASSGGSSQAALANGETNAQFK
ncbi:nuclear transcription factor Y subunit B-6 [Ziziphus jujuba]|uniref:Nuclear transcription factor Y subunit B-6 n=1 Tax=Ziziphus jujuba TaxID=326968 RepID=A0A6P3Z547_ZIZJJ|nr:nuclear transcription factor Y subunit B-6 [Ziziphus jujuba]